MRSELKRSQLKTFIYFRPLYVKSVQSTITCAYIFFSVQMTFMYYMEVKEVYIPFQVHLSMYVYIDGTHPRSHWCVKFVKFILGHCLMVLTCCIWALYLFEADHIVGSLVSDCRYDRASNKICRVMWTASPNQQHTLNPRFIKW